MTEDEIAKLRDSLLQAMRVDPQLGVPVTIENFEAAAELAKLNQAECYHLNGRLYIRRTAVSLVARSARYIRSNWPEHFAYGLESDLGPLQTRSIQDSSATVSGKRREVGASSKCGRRSEIGEGVNLTRISPEVSAVTESGN